MRITKGSKVYVMQELYNASNEVWAQVNVNGSTGYMMSKFLTADPPDATYKVTCCGMSWPQVQKIREVCPPAEVQKE